MHRICLVLLARGNPESLQDLVVDGNVVDAVSTKATVPGTSRLIRSLLLPWTQQGRALILAGHNICVERSTGRLSLLHWLYGWWLVTLVSVLRRIVRLDTPDLHMRLDATLSVNGLQRVVGNDLDAVWIEHSYLYPLAERVSQKLGICRILVNAHNVEHELKSLSALSATTVLSRCWQLQMSAICRQFESRMMRNSSLVVCCSVEDQRRLSALVPSASRSARLLVAPNGVDTSYFQGCSDAGKPPCLIFTGTAGYGPNDDAVMWLIRDLLPAIRQREPGIRCILAGRNAAAFWGKWAGSVADLEIHSDVPDMRPLLNRATAAIVPLRQGSGTRFKILEAMSMGLPVISTRLGAEGLDLVDGSDILLAESPAEFAAAVERLGRGPLLKAELVARARAVVSDRYDWGRIELQLQESLLEDRCCA